MTKLPVKANILIDGAGQARLADFGLLTIVSDPKNNLTPNSCAQGGTLRWMSPELIDPEKFGFSDCRPTKSSDCYAFGMVIYEAISGKVPFYAHRDIDVPFTVLGGERPTRGVWFTDYLWEMLERCWVSQSDDRPSIEVVLQCLRESSKLQEPPTPRMDRDPGDGDLVLNAFHYSEGTEVYRGVDPMSPDLDYVTDRRDAPVPSASCLSTPKGNVDGMNTADPNGSTTASAFEGMLIRPPSPLARMLTTHDPSSR